MLWKSYPRYPGGLRRVEWPDTLLSSGPDTRLFRYRNSDIARNFNIYNKLLYRDLGTLLAAQPWCLCVEGALRMPNRVWTEEDISKLKGLATKLPLKDIAAELGRSPGATVLKAHQLRISLRCPRAEQHTAEVSTGG